MLAAVLSLTLSCLSVPEVDAVVSSPKKTFTLDVHFGRMLLLAGDKGAPPPGELPTGVRWMADQSGNVDAYVVSDDGAWVVAARSLPPRSDPEKGVVVLFDEKGQPREVDVFPALTEEERKQLPRTDCGIAWFADARPGGDGVEVDVRQGRDPFKPSWLVTVRIERATGALTRVASPKPTPETQAAPPQRAKKKTTK